MIHMIASSMTSITLLDQPLGSQFRVSSAAQVVLQASVVVSPDAQNFLPSEEVLVDELEQGQVGNRRFVAGR